MTNMRKVLHIDDDETIRDMIIALFARKGEGYVLESAADGIQGVEKARTFRPDIILLDMKMPGMDGPATLAELRKCEGLENTPVVFFTGAPADAEAMMAKPGVIGIIQKPFKMKEAMASLDAMAEKLPPPSS